MTAPLKAIDAAAAAAAGRVRRSAPAEPGGVDPGLKHACEEMESLYLHHMLSEMRKTIDKSGLIDGGRSEEIYTSLMDVEFAREMARAGGVGLSRMLFEQLSKVKR